MLIDRWLRSFDVTQVCETTIRALPRTATTDTVATRRFRRYWRLIRLGVALVMRHALHRIKTQAERHAGVAA